MFNRIRTHLTSAHLIAALALFIALGATAWAVERNSVGTKQLKNGAVKTGKIAKGAVTTPKLRGNAVTGAKVNEATLGQVPSAATAGSAQSAATATSAATADSAADASALAGRSLGQVRSFANGATDTSAQGLDGVNFEQVMTAPMSIPAGGADLIANATVELVSNVAGQRGAQCELRNEGTDMGGTFTVTLPGGFSTVMSLTGFADNLAGTFPGNARDISIHCVGSGGADDISFVEGVLAIERIPSGS
jgi:hypothetical protein